MTVTKEEFDEFRTEVRGILKAIERRLEYIDAACVIAIRQGRANGLARGLDTTEADDWLRDRSTIPPSAEATIEAHTAPEHPVVTDTRIRILVVDDDPHTRGAIRRVLDAAGFAVMVAVDGDQAISLIQQQGCFDLAIVDQNLGAGTDRGVEVCDDLRGACPSQRLMLISGADVVELEGRDIAFLPKPWGGADVLVGKIRELLEPPNG